MPPIADHRGVLAPLQPLVDAPRWNVWQPRLQAICPAAICEHMGSIFDVGTAARWQAHGMGSMRSAAPQTARLIVLMLSPPPRVAQSSPKLEALINVEELGNSAWRWHAA